MDHIKYSPSSGDEKAQPDDLLEENWFFGNFLNNKTTPKAMSKGYSDPRSSPMENEKPPQRKHGLMRAPSLPVNSGSMEKSSFQKAQTSLHQASSPPPCIGREEDAESEFSLSRLIRQASLSSSDELPPKNNPKGIKQCSRSPRYCSQKKPLPGNNEIEASNEMRNQSNEIQNKLRRSMSDVNLRRVERPKDGWYKFDKKCTNPIVVPRFQEKSRMEYDESSSSEDMKAQIKYWARAVASNVR